MLVSKDQILEWIDNPVTIAVWSLCNWECESLLSRPLVDGLYRGDPQKTQEQLIEDATKILDWTAFVNILNGHFRSEFIHDDESEKRFNLLVEEFKDEPDEGSDEGEPE